MTEPRRLIVHTPPVAKARARVAIRNGRAHGFTPRKTEEAEWRIRTEWIAAHGLQPTDVALALDVIAFVKLPASVSKARRATALPTTRPDADNYLKTVLDALNEVAWRDDSLVVDARIQKRYALDGIPRWEILVVEALP